MPKLAKADIVDILEEIALLLEIKGDNPFKIRAYQNGARTLETLEDNLDDVMAEGRLASIKGIGSALVDKIETLHATGELEYFDKLKASVPAGLVEMVDIPGLGGKKIKALYAQLGIEDIPSLEAACNDGRVAELKGFGKKTAEKIITGIRNREAYNARHMWWTAEEVAMPILEQLRKQPGAIRAEAAGSFRRGKETVGDLDFIVASEEPAPIMDWFCTMPDVVEVTAHGSTKSSIRLSSGLQADLRIVPEAQFAFALHHFTGSKEHNVAMRQRALARGYSLSEWGLTAKDEGSDLPPITANTEKELFAALDMEFVPPELRENRGEIEAAAENALPELLETSDLRGSFHNHTTASDGRHSLEEMVQAAEDLGWEYLGIADHSQASFQANGLDAERVAKQIEAIDALNASGKHITHVFTGIECDILSDGRLDLDDEILGRLDYVVSSVHNALGQDEDVMTARLIKALENPHTTMLGHMTGRLLLKREPSKVDVNKVIDCAIANGKIIELNASPYRLDMDWRLWKNAAQKGLLCSINPDAHHIDHYAFQKAGVLTARKGWLTRKDVLNTRTLNEVKTYLKEAKR